MIFPAHGEVEVRREGRLLLARVVGPWNRELITLYRQRVAPHLPELTALGAWASIIEIRGACLCPPDALEEIRAGLGEHVNHWGRAATAYVIAPDVVGHGLMDRVWRGVYAGVTPFRIFEDADDARQWCCLRVAGACDGVRPQD